MLDNETDKLPMSSLTKS